MTATIMLEWPIKKPHDYLVVQNSKGELERARIISISTGRSYLRPGILVEFADGKREFLKVIPI